MSTSGLPVDAERRRQRYAAISGVDLTPQQGRPDVSIVIVTHQSVTDIGRCLTSVEAATDRASREVIVVDNASVDGTVDKVRQFEGVRLIAKAGRHGFSTNSNIGMAASAGRHILLLNPDAALRPGAIDALVAVLEADPLIGVAGPRLEYPDGRPQLSARRFPRPLPSLIRRTPLRLLMSEGAQARRHLIDVPASASGRSVDVEWLLGAVLALRREAIDAIGGFDDGYRLYCEDIDLCWRLHDAGWRVVYVPHIVVEHELGELTSKRFFTWLTVWHVRSMARYLRQHGFRHPEGAKSKAT